MPADFTPPGGEGFVAWVITKGPLLFAAIVGALFRAMTRHDLPWIDRLLTSAAAVMFAYLGTPVVAPIALAAIYRASAFAGLDVPPGAIEPVSMIGVTGLMLGLIGAPIMEGVLKLARGWRDNPRLP
jgi:hypothetical protein